MSLLSLTKGAIFAGDYEILGLLAEGGMGAVYVARQLSTGKDRALKIIHPQYLTDDRTRDRFAREARAASHVDSEHVIEVVSAGIDAPTGMPWLAMELLRGEDLDSFSVRIGPLPANQVLEIFRQLCHGLAAAHVTGLVHRDLKPENVFLATARRVGVPFTVKILDFGIAKIVHETKRDVTDAVGTPTWMAPEQTEAGKAITPATDVWALGLIAFRLLTGVPYWHSANTADVSAMAILREVVFDPMEPATTRARALGSSVALPPGFDGWFAKCVVRDPGERFPEATAALAGLERVFGESLPPRGEPMFAPLETVPATVKGDPFGAGTPPSSARGDAVATRAGPFAGPSSGPPSKPASVPPTEDVDDYERRLSRGKLWAWALALTVALAGVLGFWHLRTGTSRATAFNGAEGEPNNRAPDANYLPFGQKVRAQIGQRLDAERSDRDFFRTTVPPGTKVVRLGYRALPNIAPCIFVYRSTIDEPIHRFCIGQAARDLVVSALKFEPGDYLLAVFQDREVYDNGDMPPVLENVSDGYELSFGPGVIDPEVEIEPNESRASANPVAVGAAIRGRLSWMRDIDVYCAASDEPVRFTVDDPVVRARGAVLEVTPIGPSGAGEPVRVHHASAKGTATEHDVKSPYSSPNKKGRTSVCVSLTLGADIWGPEPMPHVAPAGDQEYVVRAEPL